MKSIWKGDIAFGLVSIRCQLFSATMPHTLGFKILCSKCHTPLNYERFCPHCKKEVPYENVVKGLKLPDESYFIITPEKLKELRPTKTDTIDIIEFVPQAAIDYIYLNEHYFVAPQKEGEKAFHVFKQALEQSGMVAIGRFVMRDKQYVCVINPYEDALLLTTLFYAYELRSTADIATLDKKAAVTKTEVDLAKKLIKQLAHKTFNLDRFKDEFAHNLKEAIKKGKKIKKIPGKKEITEKPKPIKKKDQLLDHLRASLKTPARTRQPIARAKATAKKG